ncbi:DUF1080 domain-containing protein [Pelagicoccus albus]
MRTLFLVGTFIFAVQAAQADSAGTYLFKGAEYGDFYFDSLEGEEPDEVFEFETDGTLLIHGEGKSEAYIQTLDEYENYEVSFEYRWPGEPGKSGIQIHCTSDTSFSIWPECIEIQLEYENSGDFWLLNTELEVEEEQMPLKAADRNRRHRLKIEEKRKYGEPPIKVELPADQWNRMRIIAKEDTVQVYLNDHLINEGKNASTNSGYITIQAEESDFVIKDFRIRELD